MKVTRSYWIGLGSGLILSAMLTLLVSPLKGQALTPQTPDTSQNSQTSQTSTSVSPIKKQTTPLATGTNHAALPSSAQPIALSEPSQNLPSNEQNSSQFERRIFIPEGSSLERIADLLNAQGLLDDKAAFIKSAYEMGVQTKFRAGAFNLTLGLTSEELIHRLLKQ